MRLAVRLTPKAARARIQGVAREADGRVVLKVAVTEPPEGGKANAALVKLLAKTWKLTKSDVTVVAGATDRRKTLHIAGEPGMLRRRLEEWIESNA